MEGKAPLQNLPDVEEPRNGVRPATTVRKLAKLNILLASEPLQPRLVFESRFGPYPSSST